MEIFTIRDLRERTGDMIRIAEHGDLSIVTENDKLVFIAVPAGEDFARHEVKIALAIKFFQDGALRLAEAARLVRMNVSEFTAKLTEQGIQLSTILPMTWTLN